MIVVNYIMVVIIIHVPLIAEVHIKTCSGFDFIDFKIRLKDRPIVVTPSALVDRTISNRLSLLAG